MKKLSNLKILLIIIFLNTFIISSSFTSMTKILINANESFIFFFILCVCAILPYIFLFSIFNFVLDNFNKMRTVKLASFANMILMVILSIFYILHIFYGVLIVTCLLCFINAIIVILLYCSVKFLVKIQNIASNISILQAIIFLALICGVYISYIFYDISNAQNILESNVSNLDCMRQLFILSFILLIIAILQFMLCFKLNLKYCNIFNISQTAQNDSSLNNHSPNDNLQSQDFSHAQDSLQSCNASHLHDYQQFSKKDYFTLKMFRKNIHILKDDKISGASIFINAIFWCMLIATLIIISNKINLIDSNTLQNQANDIANVANTANIPSANSNITNSISSISTYSTPDSIFYGSIFSSAIFVNLSFVLSAIFGLFISCLITLKYTKNYIELGFIFLGAFGMFIVLCALLYFEGDVSLVILTFLFGFFLGLIITPLNALMQFNVATDKIHSIVTTSFFFRAIFILCALIVSFLFVINKIDSNIILGIFAIVAFVISLYILKILPFSLMRIVLTICFMQRYRLIVEGFENIPKDKGVLLLGNHMSLIDWVIVQMAIPKNVYFVLQKSRYNKWYMQFFMLFLKIVNLKGNSILESSETVDSLLKAKNIVCIFPEVVVSRHGHLNEFSNEFECILQNIKDEEAVIVPFYIKGMWGSIFSLSHEQFKARKGIFFKRNIAIAFSSAMNKYSKADSIKAKVFDMSFKAWGYQCRHSCTLGAAFIESCKKGMGDIAVIDSISGKISYIKLLCVCFLLSKKIKKIKFAKREDSTSFCSIRNDCVGIILPSSLGSIICNLSAILANKIIVNLNFTLGQNLLSSQISQAKIKHIFTSKKFLNILESKGVKIDFAKIDSTLRLHFIEDYLDELKKHKINFILNLIFIAMIPSSILRFLYLRNVKIDDTCAILFSSGSENAPKGVMLSHLNIMSNIYQIADVIHARADDSILSSLPQFHAFGLTVTTFMPLIENMPCITCADPTDSMNVAKLIALYKITIICATSTLLGLYSRNKNIHKVMFESIRMTVAGAEKLKKEVRTMYAIKFNKPIYEGYGATETTPVASVNLPDEFDNINLAVHIGTRDGSVGMPLPGTTIRIVNPDTLLEVPTNEQGLILIGGHQVMQGYLNNEKLTNDVIVTIDNIRWYKSGDKGYLDKDGFLYITDRYSRFIKIGAEMISLSSIEEEIAHILHGDESLKDLKICAVGLEDEKKGEKLVLLIEDITDSYQYAVDLIKKSSMPPIKKPKEYFIVDKIPLLGSGKVDLKGAKNLAQIINDDNIAQKNKNI